MSPIMTTTRNMLGWRGDRSVTSFFLATGPVAGAEVIKEGTATGPQQQGTMTSLIRRQAAGSNCGFPRGSQLT